MHMHDSSYLAAAHQHLHVSATGSYASSTWTTQGHSWPHELPRGSSRQQTQYRDYTVQGSVRLATHVLRFVPQGLSYVSEALCTLRWQELR